MSNTVVLSETQAAIIVRAIIPDIKKYIAEHQTEYAAFLQKWNEQRQTEEARPCN